MRDRVDRPDPTSAPKILSLVQGETVTGPIKPLLLLARAEARPGFTGPRPARLGVTTRRHQTGEGGAPSALEQAAQAHGLSLESHREAFRFDPRILWSIRRSMLRFGPDIVESHDSKSHTLAWLLRATLPARRKFTWVAFHHGYTRTSWAVRIYQQLDRLTLRNVDGMATLCRPFVEQLTGRGVDPERISVLTNFVEHEAQASTDSVAALRAQLGIGATDLVLLVVGRLSAEKGHGDLLQALRAVPSEVEGHPVRLVVVGDGPEQGQLRAAAPPTGNRVIFAGFQSNTMSFYTMADVFVLPSHSEGSPLVLLEAMSAGLPVVATRVGGVPELVEHGVSALLVTPSQPQEMAEALTALLSSSEYRRKLSDAAHARLAEFTVERYSGRLWELYAQARGRKLGHLAQAKRLGSVA